MCKSHDLRIVNGRKTGNLFGKFQWNGNAVVDYLVTQTNIFEKISVFKIGEHLPWLSDHCAIHCSLELNRQPEIKTEFSNLQKRPKIFKWDKHSSSIFKDKLKENVIQDRLSKYCEQEITDPNATTLEITKLLIDTAEIAKIKIKKQRAKIFNKTWFDKECKRSKLHLKTLGKNLKNDIKTMQICELKSVTKKENLKT